jgi:Arc/MetJ-type ribon-helix-helix transcriptional regulator
MSSTRIISVSMPEAQAKAAEQLAKAENRTMSELVREALRHYEKEKRRQAIDENRARMESLGIKEEDVVRIIRQWRKEQRVKGEHSDRT